MPEDLRMRLRAAEGPRADDTIGVEPVVGDELVQVAAAVRDQADLDAVLPQRGERGQRVLVERETLVLLPGTDELLGAGARPFGVAAHPAHDLLREDDPQLVVVLVVRMALQPVERGEAGVLVALRVEREPMPLADLAVPLGAELGARPREREVDVEEHGLEHAPEDSLENDADSGGDPAG